MRRLDFPLDSSKEYIYSEYAAGRIPPILVISYCAVCRNMIDTPEVEKFTYDEFVAYIEFGGIVENEKGNLAQIKTSYMCENCKKTKTKVG